MKHEAEVDPTVRSHLLDERFNLIRDEVIAAAHEQHLQRGARVTDSVEAVTPAGLFIHFARLDMSATDSRVTPYLVVAGTVNEVRETPVIWANPPEMWHGHTAHTAFFLPPFREVEPDVLDAWSELFADLDPVTGTAEHAKAAHVRMQDALRNHEVWLVRDVPLGGQAPRRPFSVYNDMPTLNSIPLISLEHARAPVEIL